MSAFTFADLFAGIGGFHVAFHELGARCVFACEIDKHARETYHKNFSTHAPDLFDSGNFAEDILKVDPNAIPEFDILCAGFPCQPFSQAGYKRGFAEEKDNRGNMFHQIVRILSVKRPRAFFLENVRHLLNHDNGRTFSIIRKTLEEELNYSFYYQVVKASDYGLPQHRPRIFMIGFRDEALSSRSFTFPQRTPLRLTMSDILKGKCDKKIGYTLRVGGQSSGIGDRRNWDTYLVDEEIRRISPEEGKQMMGFPSNFILPCARTQSMKQLGNSVAVSAVSEVAKALLSYLKEDKIITNFKQETNQLAPQFSFKEERLVQCLG